MKLIQKIAVLALSLVLMEEAAAHMYVSTIPFSTMASVRSGD